MNALTQIDLAKTEQDIEGLASDLAREEHDGLTYRRELLDPRGWAVETFDDDWNYRACAEEFFDANRDRFLEQAREELTLEVFS